MVSVPNDLTQLQVDWGNGDQAALEELLPLVNNELRRLARSYMRRETPVTLFKPPHSSTKPTCDWSIREMCDGRTVPISSDGYLRERSS